MPGPGQYKPNNLQGLQNSASYSLKGKHYLGTSIAINEDGSHEKMQEGGSFKTPGPGSYKPNPNSVYASTSTRFAMDKRSSMTRLGAEKIPAPNAYDGSVKNKVL